MQKNHITLFLIVATLAALWMRWSFMVETDIIRPIRADAEDYAIYAYNLVQHGVYSRDVSDTPSPDSYRSPGFPLLIAAAFHLGGGQKTPYDLVIWIHIVLGAFMVPLTFWWAHRMMNLWLAGVAALLVALSPHLVAMNSYFLTESLFGFVLLLAMGCWAKGWEAASMRWIALAGAGFGLSYLTNETALLVPLVLVLSALLHGKYVRGQWLPTSVRRPLVVFVVVFALFPSAWMMRSALSLQPDSSRGGHRALATFSHGTYPGFIYESVDYKYYPYDEDPLQPAFGASVGRFVDIFSERFAKRPMRYVSWYALEKPYYFWSWDNLQSKRGTHEEMGRGDVYVYPVKTSWYYESVIGRASRGIMWLMHPLLLLIALGGIPLLFVAYKRRLLVNINVSQWTVFALLFYYTALYTAFYPLPRYSVPLRPELYVWCMLVVHLGWQIKNSRPAQSEQEPG